MAIYHFSAQVISRSQGRSSVASSAYRSAEKMMDERTGLTHDFTRKSDVIESEVLLPNNAPEYLKNRERLWNIVEQTEKRKDAQVAREINVALLREFTSEQNWDLLKSFVKKEFVDQGMIADVNFHGGHQGNRDQPHGHIMLTMREVHQEGFGQKVRAWNDKLLLNEWRERWAEYCNLELAKNGFDFRVDQRTLEAQGINLEAQSKIGPKVSQASMARFEEHQALARRNGERLLSDPSITMKALTRQQSTFTHQDLARFVNSHTFDADQFTAVYEKIKAHPDLVFLGQDERHRERFTTREMLFLETTMVQQAINKAQKFKHPISDQSISQGMLGKSLSEEQAKALRHITQGGDVSCVLGFAGTGKSYLLDSAREAWESEGYCVQGMTLSGIAAESLKFGSGIESYTVANRLWHWDQEREQLTDKDIVVVDEAGMLGSRQMAKILDEVDRSGAKLVLIGDPEQLQAIEAGAPYRAIAERVGFMEMTEIRRQQESWQQQATRDFASERTLEGISAYEQHDRVHTFDTKEMAMLGMIEQWEISRNQLPEKTQIMLAYTRNEVHALNEQARQIRQAKGELGSEIKVETSRGERTFAEGDRVYFLRNENRELQVKNGTLGTLERIQGKIFTIRLDGRDKENSRFVEVNLKSYNDIDHGYAATVYKAQGVTVDRSHVLASEYFDRHSTYVAMSRHRENADLYISQDVFLTRNQLNETLSRERSKDVTLDYARNRHFEVNEQNHTQDRNITLHKSRFPETFELEQAKQADIAMAEKKMGLKLSTELKEGDRGIYRGNIEIAGRQYGVIEQENKQGKLIHVYKLESQKKGEEMVIERKMRLEGKDIFKGHQPAVRERGVGRSVGRER